MRASLKTVAQAKALAAAHAALEASAALLTYAREGGPVGNGERHDMTYPLADALRLALEAVHDRSDRLPDDDNELLNAVQKWIEAPGDIHC
jgi:hypothetical protein